MSWWSYGINIDTGSSGMGMWREAVGVYYTSGMDMFWLSHSLILVLP